MDKQAIAAIDGGVQSVGALDLGIMNGTFLAQVEAHSLAAIYTHG